MKAPPPTPELCGSTSDSIAWTAIAASTALPPRFSTFSPAWAASGLAAMTNGSVAATWAGCAERTRDRADARQAAQAPNARRTMRRACG